jgi:hypothetical protein
MRASPPLPGSQVAWAACGMAAGLRSLFGRHQAAVVDLSHANSTIELPMDLILGYPTLRQADWLIDFPASRWTVMDPS